jgi:O-antigen/teichoic acid export membrane protein
VEINNKYKDYIAKIFVRGSGDFIAQGLKIVALTVLIRLFDDKDLGAWAQIQVLLLLLPVLYCLRIETAIVRLITNETISDATKIIITGHLIPIVVGFVTGVAILFFSEKIAILLFNDTSYQHSIIILNCWIVVRSIIEVSRSVLRAFEKIKFIFIVQLISGINFIIIATIAYNFAFKLNHILIVYIAFDVLIAITIMTYITIYIININDITIKFNILEKYIKYSYPLIFNKIVDWSNSNFGKYILLYLLGLEFVGIYYVATTIAQILKMILNPLHFVLFPRVANLSNCNQKLKITKYIEFSLHMLIILGLPCLFGINLVLPSLMENIFKLDYNLNNILIMLCAAYLLELIKTNYRHILLLNNKTKQMLTINAIMLFVSCSVNLFFIKNLNLFGAGLATLIIEIISFCIMLNFTKNILWLKYDFSIIAKVLVSCFLFYWVLHYTLNGKQWYYLLFTPLSGMCLYILSLYFLNILPNYIVKFLIEEKN